MDDLMMVCMNFVNKSSEEKQILNRLYGLKNIHGKIYGQVVKNKEECWLPLEQLCTYHEMLIKKFMKLK